MLALAKLPNMENHLTLNLLSQSLDDLNRLSKDIEDPDLKAAFEQAIYLRMSYNE